MNEIVISVSEKDFRFRVFATGEIHRETKGGAWKPINNTPNHKKGYNVILVNKRQFMRSRFMLLAFMNHDKLPEKIVMHHKDGDRLNCDLSNLTVETYSSISHYRTDTCGWQYDPKTDKYHSSITKDGETISLGVFSTSDEAYDAYIHARTQFQEAYHGR
jgi:hypothetical protein